MKSKVFYAGFLALLALLVFGCVTNNNAASGVPEAAVTAMGVPQGIEIYFQNIPEETNHLYITLHDATENYEILSYVRIFDDELDILKDTGSLICPFTEKGHVYRISIYYYSQDNALPDDCVNVAATARGGNYPSELSFDIPQVYENMVWAIGIPRKVDSIALF